MIKKKNLREKLQQRQNLKRDLNDPPANKTAPLSRSSDIQILDERSSTSSYIQKQTRGGAPPPPQPSSRDHPRSSAQRGAPANQNHAPSAAQPAHSQIVPRGKGVKPPRPGNQLLLSSLISYIVVV
jgi:hypothetical protein